MSRIIRRSSLMTVVALLCTSCGDSTPTAVQVPGALVVSLSTPNSDDGAILISISGGGIGSPSAESSTHVFYSRATSPLATNAAVVGNITSGPLLRFNVPDVGRASSYVATISQVADRDNDLRATLTGYALRITPEGVGSP